jgi:hypothetical protein
MIRAGETGSPSGQRVVHATFGDGLCLRLIDPPDPVLRQVATELGAVAGLPAGLPADPILTVRFTEPVGTRADLIRLGLTDHPFAFDSERFYLIGRRGHLTAIDFRALDTTEIEIERGESTIPLLLPLLSLRLVAMGRVLLHAASFVHEGRAVVATGWQSGGKSELLFAFMVRGATYLADEWTIVRGDGSIEGFASDVHFWDWQLRALPPISARISGGDLRRLAALRVAGGPVRLLRGGRRPTSVRRTLADLERWLDNAARVRIAPATVFDGRVHRGSLHLDDVLLATVGGHDTTVLPVEGREVAARIGASLDYERRELSAAYAQYRYAFPERTSELLEGGPRLEREILADAFAGVRAHEVRHRYPPSFTALYNAVSAVLDAPAG